MRRPERLAPGRVGDQRHQRAMRAARRRTRNPVVLAGRVHRIVHEAVRARLDARPAIVGRAIEPHRGAERAARHFERADQAGNQRARPAALVAAPAVVDGLAERDRRPAGTAASRPRSRSSRRRGHDRGTRWRRGGWWRPEHRRSAPPIPANRPSHGRPDARRRDCTATARCVVSLLIGADLDAVDREGAFERRIDSGGVERHRAPAA